MIRKLNPIIRGWANYYRTQVSSETFNTLDAYLWRRTWKWANSSHPNKPKPWVFARYYGKFHKSRQDRWWQAQLSRTIASTLRAAEMA